MGKYMYVHATCNLHLHQLQLSVPRPTTSNDKILSPDDSTPTSLADCLISFPSSWAYFSRCPQCCFHPRSVGSSFCVSPSHITDPYCIPVLYESPQLPTLFYLSVATRVLLAIFVPLLLNPFVLLSRFPYSSGSLLPSILQPSLFFFSECLLLHSLCISPPLSQYLHVFFFPLSVLFSMLLLWSHPSVRFYTSEPAPARTCPFTVAIATKLHFSFHSSGVIACTR